MNYNTDDRDAYFFDRNAPAETPTVFWMGKPLHKCMAAECNQEPHPQSDSYECADHTLIGLIAEAAEEGVLSADGAAEIARWHRIAEGK